MKIAVYVEGHTELIFVRDLLLKWFDYDGSKIRFNCYNLFGSLPPGQPVPYSYGDENAGVFYEIVNVGSDNSVLSKAMKNAQRYINLGYNRIVTLRDMYSDNYHQAVYEKHHSRVIDWSIIEKFIQGSEESVKFAALDGFIQVNFAIMEIESWLLGMADSFLEREDAGLTSECLKECLELDLASMDPEVSIYHPTKTLNAVYELIGRGYGKHVDEVNSIMAKIQKDDIELLLLTGKCHSFSRFMTSLIPAFHI